MSTPKDHVPMATGVDVVRDLSRALAQQERRPQPTGVRDLLGPGFGSYATELLNWNSSAARFNGFWSATDAKNGPTPTGRYMGLTIAATGGHVAQIAISHEHSDADPDRIYLRRVHTHTSQAAHYSPWQLIAPGGTGGTVDLGPVNAAIAALSTTVADLETSKAEAADLSVTDMVVADLGTSKADLTDLNYIPPSESLALSNGIADDSAALTTDIATAATASKPLLLDGNTRIATAMVIDKSTRLLAAPGAKLTIATSGIGLDIRPVGIPAGVVTATAVGATTVTVTGSAWPVNGYAGRWAEVLDSTVNVVSGDPTTHARRVISNTADTLTLDSPIGYAIPAGATLSLITPIDEVDLRKLTIDRTTVGNANLVVRYVRNVRMRRVTVSNAGNYTTGSGNAVSIYHADKVRIEDLAIERAGNFGMFIYNCDNVRVTNPTVTHWGGQFGIQLKDCRNGIISKGTFVADGVKGDNAISLKCSGLNAGYDLKAVDCRATGTKQSSFEFSSITNEGTGHSARNLRFVRCTSDKAGTSGFTVVTDTTSTPSALVWDSCFSGESTQYGYSASVAKGLKIINCTARLNRFEGVHVGTSDVEIIGGLMEDNAQAYTTGATRSSEIYCDASALRTRIEGVTFRRTAAGKALRAVRELAGATATVIRDCKIREEVAAYVQDYLLVGTRSAAFGNSGADVFTGTPVINKKPSGGPTLTPVAAYGVVGDGIIDNTAAINVALTAASVYGSRTVVLPPGTYVISSTLNVPAYVTLHGPGAVIKCGAAMGTGVELGSHATLSGVTVDASATGTIRPVQIDDNADGARIDQCEIFGKADVAAVAATGAGVGISFRPGVKNLLVRDTHIHDVEIGLNCIYDVTNLTLERVRVSNWSGRAIRIYGTGTYRAKTVKIRDCTIDPPVGPDPIHPIIALSDSGPVHEDISVTGCTVTGRGTAYEDDGTADQISINDTRGVQIIGNTSLLGGERGINCSRRSSDIIIMGNHVEAADGPGIGVGDYTSGVVSNFQVTGNLVKNNGQDRDGNKAIWSLAGIRLMFAKHGVVSGNTCIDDQGTPTQDAGISLGYGCDNVEVGPNVFNGNTNYKVWNVQGTTIGGNTNIRFGSPDSVSRTTDAAPRPSFNTMDATADDDTLKVWLDGQGRYRIDALIPYSGHTDGDMRFGFGLPTGATMVFLTGDGIAGNQTSAASQTLNRATSTTFVTVGAVTGTDLAAKPSVYITTGDTGGWATFRWAQGGTPQVHDTLIRAGSTLTVTRIA